MSVIETIERKLTEALSPAQLVVKDESHLHSGHAGSPENGASHFRVTIIAESFEGMTRVDRQRRVNGILSEELKGPVHALAMKTLTPDEAAQA